MDSTQPTQPTQQAAGTPPQEPQDEAHICRLICATGQYGSIDLNTNAATRTRAHAQRKTWVFGRNGECDVVLHTCSRLSNRHFLLWLSLGDDTVWIQDTSTNGTYLNGSRLVKGLNYIVSQGDEISVGVGVAQDVVKFVVLFGERYNPQSRAREPAAPPAGIHRDFIVRSETLGQGAFATVKKVIERRTGDAYAAKIISRRRALAAGGRGAMAGVDRELAILRQLDHPHIVRLHSFYEDAENYYLVMELVPGGDLMDFVAANGAVGEAATQVIARQVLEGIAYVHRLGISHRDLKPDNILILQDDPIVVKITDFGLAKISDGASLMKTFCGTLAYVAPEVLTGKPDPQLLPAAAANYSCLVDIWLLGCLVYVLLTSHLPFNGKTQAQMFLKIKLGDFLASPLAAYDVSPPALDFLRCCLAVDPARRPSAAEALRHPWLAAGHAPEHAAGLRLPPLSLSQLTLQQSRRIEHGIHISASSHLDDDLMLRPLDRAPAHRNARRGQEFKVPRRVAPLPQLQPLHASLLRPAAAPNGGASTQAPPRSAWGDSGENAGENAGGDAPKDARKDAPKDAQKDAPRDAPPAALSEHMGSLSVHAPLAEAPLTGRPRDLFITLAPLANSFSSEPIYVRQGVNPYAIGRNEACDTFVNDDRMSKIHCLIHRRRHPMAGASIFESPAHCLEDLWLLDFSTNSCHVNGVRVGKCKKVQLFNGDRIDLFVDESIHQLLSFTLAINDATGLFRGGERAGDADGLVQVIRLDANDEKLRPAIVPEPAPQTGAARGAEKGSIAGYGGNFKSLLRLKRKMYDDTRSSPLKPLLSKRAHLQSGQARPTNSWA